MYLYELKEVISICGKKVAIDNWFENLRGK